MLTVGDGSQSLVHLEDNYKVAATAVQVVLLARDMFDNNRLVVFEWPFYSFSETIKEDHGKPGIKTQLSNPRPCRLLQGRGWVITWVITEEKHKKNTETLEEEQM